MRFLPDVNVLFPLLVSRHAHREKALAWFEGIEAGDAALCRITRLGVLRLLCTPQVMGPDALRPEAALEAVAVLEGDERMVLAFEPDGLDGTLRSLVASRTSSPNLWTDAYLAAFAQTSELRLVSFDRGFAKFSGLDFLALG